MTHYEGTRSQLVTNFIKGVAIALMITVVTVSLLTSVDVLTGNVSLRHTAQYNILKDECESTLPRNQICEPVFTFKPVE